ARRSAFAAGDGDDLGTAARPLDRLGRRLPRADAAARPGGDVARSDGRFANRAGSAARPNVPKRGSAFAAARSFLFANPQAPPCLASPSSARGVGAAALSWPSTAGGNPHQGVGAADLW